MARIACSSAAVATCHSCQATSRSTAVAASSAAAPRAPSAKSGVTFQLTLAPPPWICGSLATPKGLAKGVEKCPPSCGFGRMPARTISAWARPRSARVDPQVAVLFHRHPRRARGRERPPVGRASPTRVSRAPSPPGSTAPASTSGRSSPAKARSRSAPAPTPAAATHPPPESEERPSSTDWRRIRRSAVEGAIAPPPIAGSSQRLCGLHVPSAPEIERGHGDQVERGRADEPRRRRWRPSAPPARCRRLPPRARAAGARRTPHPPSSGSAPAARARPGGWLPRPRSHRAARGDRSCAGPA